MNATKQRATPDIMFTDWVDSYEKPKSGPFSTLVLRCGNIISRRLHCYLEWRYAPVGRAGD